MQSEGTLVYDWNAQRQIYQGFCATPTQLPDSADGAVAAIVNYAVIHGKPAKLNNSSRLGASR